MGRWLVYHLLSLPVAKKKTTKPLYQPTNRNLGHLWLYMDYNSINYRYIICINHSYLWWKYACITHSPKAHSFLEVQGTAEKSRASVPTPAAMFRSSTDAVRMVDFQIPEAEANLMSIPSSNTWYIANMENHHFRCVNPLQICGFVHSYANVYQRVNCECWVYQSWTRYLEL